LKLSQGTKQHIALLYILPSSYTAETAAIYSNYRSRSNLSNPINFCLPPASFSGGFLTAYQAVQLTRCLLVIHPVCKAKSSTTIAEAPS
jgi:alpha-D-ribose 1-methylphosphonate 5-triphosphate synthase subunit PhnL